MRFSYSQYAAVFKALSDETRIKIIELLCTGEHSGCGLLKYFHITQPTLSYHMRILIDSGLVVGTKKGCLVNYSINPQNAAMVRCFIEDLARGKTEDIFPVHQKTDETKVNI